MTHSDETMKKAYEAGRSNMIFDGMWLVDKLPCQCELCVCEYARGQEAGERELFSREPNLEESE